MGRGSDASLGEVPRRDGADPLRQSSRLPQQTGPQCDVRMRVMELLVPPSCGSKTANSPAVLRSAESSADHQTQIVTPFSFLNDKKVSGVRRNRVTAPRESTNVLPANAFPHWNRGPTSVLSARTPISQPAAPVFVTGHTQPQGFLLCPRHSPRPAQQLWPARLYLLQTFHPHP